MSGSTPSTAAEPGLHVVAGVLARGEEFLVAQRPIGGHQAGQWEFPGGKLRAGETAPAALARELREELGIDVRAARPLIRLRYAYPDRRVLLDVWRVTAFAGEPQGREGQRIRWVHRDALTTLDWLAANRPVVQAVRLPTLYLITDAQRVQGPAFLPVLERALRAGARLLQLRAPQLDAGAFQELARTVVPLCHRYGARVLLNGDPEWVRPCAADGVHLNGVRLRALRRRPLPPEYWVGASTHDAQELALAAALEADFVVLSPVLPTKSQWQREPLGWDRFGELVETFNLPVYALGGMRREHIETARARGAQGLAMVSGIWEACDMEAVITALD